MFIRLIPSPFPTTQHAITFIKLMKRGSAESGTLVERYPSRIKKPSCRTIPEIKHSVALLAYWLALRHKKPSKTVSGREARRELSRGRRILNSFWKMTGGNGECIFHKRLVRFLVVCVFSGCRKQSFVLTCNLSDYIRNTVT